MLVVLWLRRLATSSCDGSARVTDVAGAAAGPPTSQVIADDVPTLIGPQGDGLPGM